MDYRNLRLILPVKFFVDEVNGKWMLYRLPRISGWVHCNQCDSEFEVETIMDEVALTANSLEELLKEAKRLGFQVEEVEYIADE